MWQKIADLTKLVFSFGETLQQNRSDIKELQHEMRQLATAMQLLAQEVRHMRKTQESEQEKTLLRLENELLKFERRLPPSKSE